MYTLLSLHPTQSLSHTYISHTLYAAKLGSLLLNCLQSLIIHLVPLKLRSNSSPCCCSACSAWTGWHMTWASPVMLAKACTTRWDSHSVREHVHTTSHAHARARTCERRGSICMRMHRHTCTYEHAQKHKRTHVHAHTNAHLQANITDPRGGMKRKKRVKKSRPKPSEDGERGKTLLQVLT